MRYINMHLTIMGPNNSQWWQSSDPAGKTKLGGTKDNDSKTRQVYVDRNKHCLGKEWRLHAQ